RYDKPEENSQFISSLEIFIFKIDMPEHGDVQDDNLSTATGNIAGDAVNDGEHNFPEMDETGVTYAPMNAGM
ncbi:MAG: hypothetical protein JXA35_06715, partial [Deltaproteobacteria bacterium]|nr:hypothetical protein [Deltaproteobacteria bacterium]